MKVLFLTHRLPFAPNRGDRIRAYHMLQHLSRHASVSLLSLVHEPEEETASMKDLPVDRVAVVRTTPWRNRVRSVLTLPTSQPLTHTLLDAPDLPRAVSRIVQASRPDVVLAYCSGVARLALAEPLASVPLVLDMVDVDSAKWLALSRTTAPPLGWIYAREARCLGQFEVDVVRHARTTLVVNEREHRTLAEAAPGADVRIVPNGIDLERFRSNEPAAIEPRVVFCGVMSYQPNDEAAMSLVRDIWPRVRAERPDARLTIVGASPTARLLQAAAGDATIEVTGAVPDVRPYLWNAAVSVAPLKTARGVQNKVLEALAADLPVVVTPAVAHGLPSAALSGCIVANDEEESAGALLSLLRLPPIQRRAVARLADLSELGWKKQLSSLLPVLTAAASRKPMIRLAS